MSAELHPVYGTFAPGASPFRIKGLAYQAFLKHIEEDIPGGVVGVMAQVDDPRTRVHFDQHFLSSSMYDVLPLFDVGQIAARIANRPYRALVREGAQRLAKRDATGVYRALLRIASLRMVAERIPRILMQYLDFGAMSGTLTTKSHFEGVVSGIPKPACAWFQSSVEGFAPVVLEIAGATQPEIRFHRFEQEKTISQMPIMTGRVHIKWSD